MHGDDLYTILGISPAADQAEVQRAYRSTARVVHPDRFDPQTQRAEWEQANDMLRKVNHAYEVLRDPARRAAYDRKRAGSQNAERPIRDAGSKRPPSSTFVRPKAGSARIADVPPSVLCQFAAEATDNGARRFIKTKGVAPTYFWLAVLLSWYPLLVFGIASGAPWGLEGILVVSTISLIVAWLNGVQLYFIYRWHTSPVRPRLYVTPLHIVETTFGRIQWWPIADLRDMRVTHQHQNGLHLSTELVLEFPSGASTQSISSRSAAENWLSSLRKYNARMKRAYAQQNWRYFTRHNPFSALSPAATAPNKWPRVRIAIQGAVATAAFVVLMGSIAYNEAQPRPVGPATGSAQVSEDKSATAARGDPGPHSVTDQILGRAAARENGDDLGERAIRSSVPALTPLPLPDNGAIRRLDSSTGVAPLEIRTKGGDQHYLIKLSDWVSDAPVLTVFVHGGQSVELLVPLGSYHFKYATGLEWYGYDDHFGPKTAYYRAEARLDFTDSGSAYTGYSVELYRQSNGNLRTSRIEPSEW